MEIWSIIFHFSETKDCVALGRTCKQLKMISDDYLKITYLYLSHCKTLQNFYLAKTTTIVDPLPKCRFNTFLKQMDTDHLNSSFVQKDQNLDDRIGILIIPKFGQTLCEALKEDNLDINWLGRTTYPVQRQAVMTIIFQIESIEWKPYGITDPIYLEKVQKAVSLAHTRCFKTKISLFSKTLRFKGIDP